MTSAADSPDLGRPGLVQGDPSRSHSILFDLDGEFDGLTSGADATVDVEVDIDQAEAPAFFADLHLDQVVQAITAGREAYDLTPFFYLPLRDVAAVRYRQEVLRDLERDEVAAAIAAFARTMASMREQLARAQKLHYPRQRQRWFLDTAAAYGDAVSTLASQLTPLELHSRGLRAFRDYLTSYAGSAGFTELARDTRALQRTLGEVRYRLHIRDIRITVSRYDGEGDYTAEVEAAFAKFKQGAVKDYRVKLADWPDMNHVEARVLDLVARLHPDVFGTLDAYCARHRDYLDPTVGAFDREVQFYLAFLDYTKQFTSAGLAFCYPQVSDQSKEVVAQAAFDLALATKLLPEGSAVVCNDVQLTDPERIVVVTGPNQGGKTTFARMFGQLHYLASLGLQVPARSAQLFLPDRLFTHFEREEDLATLRGKLDDELVRLHDILQRATSRSILIMNETFTSTTLNDALLLGTAVLKQLIELDLLCVYVTFVDELASLGETTVSMVAAVAPDEPTARTYKLVRKPADGLAYAAALADKHGLSYQALRGRIAR